MILRQWHLFLHAWATEGAGNSVAAQADGSLLLKGEQLQEPFAISFEEMCRRFETLPGAWCEPDGAVGWNPPRETGGDGALENGALENGAGDNGPGENGPGQYLGGTLHCLDERVMCVELFVHLRQQNWLRMLDALMGEERRIAIQLAEEGVFVSPEGFLHRAFATPLA